jgi:2-dehydro-3-deoxyphosphooctonate aldolase (KDO 8-P synthase)
VSPAPRATEIVPGVRAGGEGPLLLIAGTCVVESRESALRHAAALRRIAERAGVPLIFKASYDKANRTSVGSFRGPGLEQGLEILAEVRRETGLPLLSDVHEAGQCAAAAEVLDVLQIPAFLCRQTDLVQAAVRTGKAVNLKKGQFLAPWDTAPLIEKAREAGGRKILLTERGSSFGYNNLVVDMKGLPEMRALGVPVIFDATHSVQLPGGLGGRSGGQSERVPALARAAVGAGVDGLFFEVHEDPSQALSDGPNALPLERLSGLLRTLLEIDAAVRATTEP